jgi:hypothetical protein
MRVASLTLSMCVVIVTFGCGASGVRDSRRAEPASTPVVEQAAVAPSVPKSVTCALLSAEEIREVRGEEPSDAQGSEHLSGGLVMSQCFFRLPTFGKSINLEVVRAAPDSHAHAVKDFWRARFGREAVEEHERERERKEKDERGREEELEREKARGQVREGGHADERGEEGEESRPQRVAGLGDEAYWTGGQAAAVLSLLKGDTVIQIGVGGPEDDDAKLKTAKALALKVLKHF